MKKRSLNVHHMRQHRGAFPKLSSVMEQVMQEDQTGDGSLDHAAWKSGELNHGYSIQRRPWFYHRHDKEGPSWAEVRASLEVIKLYLKKQREGDDSPQDYVLLYRQGIARSDRDPRYRLDSF